MVNKLAGWLYKKLENMHRKPNYILYNDAVRQDLQTLEPAGNTQARQRQFVMKKLSLCGMIVVIGVIFSIVLWIKDGKATEIVDNSIARNPYGDGTKNVTLVAEDDGGDYSVSFEIAESRYTYEELMQAIETSMPVIKNSFFYEKESVSRGELIQRQLTEIEIASRGDKKVTLPSEIEGQKIDWSYKQNYRGLLFMAATPILMFLVYFGLDRDLHKQVEDREEQMRMDYPEIVCSLALLIGAGMTVPNAWMKIATDYKKRKAQTGRKQYAYEEMLLTVYEMESGISQTKAYEYFGRRCRIPGYNKLAMLLSQNIRKGAANLPALLREESSDAFEERKHLARTMGEKAGTKLLVPMMMLLGITLVIIMVPAFQMYF